MIYSKKSLLRALIAVNIHPKFRTRDQTAKSKKVHWRARGTLTHTDTHALEKDKGTAQQNKMPWPRKVS